jgi:hypothetical protein
MQPFMRRQVDTRGETPLQYRFDVDQVERIEPRRRVGLKKISMSLPSPAASRAVDPKRSSARTPCALTADEQPRNALRT